MNTNFSWKFPDGFAAFRADQVTSAWMSAFLETYASRDADLRGAIARTVDECVNQETQPDSWGIMLGDFGDGRTGIIGIAEAAFMDAVDVHEWASRWQRDFDSSDAPKGESLLIDSKRSPAAIRRSVELREADGVRQYIEQGVIVKTWPRLAISGVLRVTATSLVTFPDMAKYLRTFAHQFEIEETVRAGH